MRNRWHFQMRRIRSLILLFIFVYVVAFIFVGVQHHPADDHTTLVADVGGVEVRKPVRYPHTTKRPYFRRRPPIPESYRCRHLAPSAPTRETFTFQSVDSDTDNYVFSSFYDHRDMSHPVVKVIGLSVATNDLYCQFSYKHRSEVLISEATVEVIFGGHGRRLVTRRQFDACMSELACFSPTLNHGELYAFWRIKISYIMYVTKFNCWAVLYLTHKYMNSANLDPAL